MTTRPTVALAAALLALGASLPAFAASVQMDGNVEVRPSNPRVGTQKRLDCNDGRTRLIRSGYDDVRTESCGGRTLRYVARKGNKLYRISMDAFSGGMRTRYLGLTRTP